MRTKSVLPVIESDVTFRVDTSYQMDHVKQYGEGCLTLVDACSYTVALINSFSEDNFLSGIKSWCESLAFGFPKSQFTCNAKLTNNETGCSMYVDAEYNGKYLSVMERDGSICLSKKVPVCIECGCKLKKVINGRRFECPDCETVYVSSAYVAEVGSEEGGCHVFCHPNSYKVKIC